MTESQHVMHERYRKVGDGYEYCALPAHQEPVESDWKPYPKDFPTPINPKSEVFISMRSDLLQQSTQQLLEGRRMARSLESLADSLIPLIENDLTRGDMRTVRESAATCSALLNSIYAQVARKAFGK